MTAESAPGAPLPPINQDLITGVDAGGTKVEILDTRGASYRYNTHEYSSMNDILEAYFQEAGRPCAVVVGMAGPRDDETGAIRLTNANWPVFNPQEASETYGTVIETANDMVVTAAGVLQPDIDLLTLKEGTPSEIGTKIVVAQSTGIGTATCVWDKKSNRFVIVAGEGGHIGFQPKNEEERQYLYCLHKKYPHASAELALSGKHGIDNLVNHSLEMHEAPGLAHAIEHARKDNRPIGSVLIEFATEGKGADQQVAQGILRNMGAMTGSVVSDYAVIHKATGGVYLTGSVALGMGEYFAQHTEFIERFTRKEGAVHHELLKKTPIYVVKAGIAVIGALALAKSL